MAERLFGEVPGIQEGAVFKDRIELARAGVHRQTQAGITGTKSDGAESIVLSGGYEDDADLGDEIIYTGQGGQDKGTRKQITDQTWTAGNAALLVNLSQGIPVRVIRGSGHPSRFSPTSGYCYDGLFMVEDAWMEAGRSGYKICRYRLKKAVIESTENFFGQLRSGAGVPGRIIQVTSRIIRDTKYTRAVKELYEYKCQVCDLRIETAGGPYAEAAHIKPLGRPHCGPDEPGNLLCLCPNHHVMFDRGVFSIGPKFALLGLSGTLMVHSKHDIHPEYLAYHREHYKK